MDWFVLAKLFSGLISLVHLVRLYGSEEALVIWYRPIQNWYFGRNHLSMARP